MPPASKFHGKILTKHGIFGYHLRNKPIFIVSTPFWIQRILEPNYFVVHLHHWMMVSSQALTFHRCTRQPWAASLAPRQGQPSVSLTRLQNSTWWWIWVLMQLFVLVLNLLFSGRYVMQHPIPFCTRVFILNLYLFSKVFFCASMYTYNARHEPCSINQHPYPIHIQLLIIAARNSSSPPWSAVGWSTPCDF